MRLLVVEDAEKLARALKRGLEREGYAVDTLNDGRLAQTRLRSRHDEYDLVVLDIMLPGVDGFTLCRDLRERGVTVPVLMLTARDTTADKVTGLDSGADDYLVKPFAFEELVARVRTLLRRPRSALPMTLTVGDLVLDPGARTVPVLMLTARDTTADKVTGLDSGADDYLVKPFAFEELVARVRTLLRRPRSALSMTLTVGDLVLDPGARSVRRGATAIDLTAKEFALLELLMRHPGEVLSRERILDHVWDDEYDAGSNVIDVHLKNLRRKIDRPGATSLFKTARGVGYGLRPPDTP